MRDDMRVGDRAPVRRPPGPAMPHLTPSAELLGLQHLMQGRSSASVSADVVPVQRKAESRSEPNRTGLPDSLKAGVEGLSGMALDDVRVHFNSNKPAQMHAHAYTQGSEIHVAPGQEKHLPHEAWHVVQQKQGRVRATRQMKGVGVNADAVLEREADVMGARAVMCAGATATARNSSGMLEARGCDNESPERAVQMMRDGLWKVLVDPINKGMTLNGLLDIIRLYTESPFEYSQIANWLQRIVEIPNEERVEYDEFSIEILIRGVLDNPLLTDAVEDMNRVKIYNKTNFHVTEHKGQPQKKGDGRPRGPVRERTKFIDTKGLVVKDISIPSDVVSESIALEGGRFESYAKSEAAEEAIECVRCCIDWHKNKTDEILSRLTEMMVTEKINVGSPLSNVALATIFGNYLRLNSKERTPEREYEVLIYVQLLYGDCIKTLTDVWFRFIDSPEYLKKQ